MVATLPENKIQNNEDFFADILAAINGTGMMNANAEPLTLQRRISSFVERGVSFVVKTDGFEIGGKSEKLNKSDTDYITVNFKAILCHLQQMLLSKEIFDQDASLFDDFRMEIAEKQSVLTDGAEIIPIEIYEAAVIETTKSWFAHTYGDNQ